MLISKMTSLAQMYTGSGKVYGPLNTAWLEMIENLSERIRSALGIPSDEDTLALTTTRTLLTRLGEMIFLSREDDYWFVTLPEILKRILDELFEIQEFWVPAVVRDLVYTIECIRKT
jgi:hypothetical protein